MSVNDIAATADGTDIDFSSGLISGIEEYRQAAFSRISNDVTYTNLDYGLDLLLEIGKTGNESSIGIRASAAIQNDARFIEAKLIKQGRTVDGDVVSISLAFDVVAQDGTEFSLAVLVTSGEVVLIR